jgi:2-polyprenyl-6-methoxyphenol hydroxylase-like FAD-dependent oxidoreductase
MRSGARVAIIGGSLSGLFTGLALARRGIDAEIIERDDIERSGGGDGEFRRGAPQARHSHAFQALGRRAMKAELPEVWDALLAAGAREMPIGAGILADGIGAPVDDDPELVGLACRRSLLESVVRDCARRQPGVTFRSGTAVTGLVTARANTPAVSGVTTSAGPVTADVVVDASGRASGLLGWLREGGVAQPLEHAESCGIAYFTRYYRVRRWPEITLNRGLGSGLFGATSAAIAFPCDNDALSITLALPAGDAELRRLGRDPAFTEAVRLHAMASAWIEPDVAEPVSEIAAMAHIENRLRRFVVNGEPLVVGFVPVGDAACITNPAFGRGMSLALVHAIATADAIAAHLGDHRGLALAADHLITSLLQPWFADAVAQDRARQALWSGATPPSPPARLTLAAVAAAAPHDARVWRAFMRRFNLLEHPDNLFADEAVVAAVNAVHAAGPPSAASGPSRADLIDLLATGRVA